MTLNLLLRGLLLARFSPVAAMFETGAVERYILYVGGQVVCVESMVEEIGQRRLAWPLPFSQRDAGIPLQCSNVYDKVTSSDQARYHNILLTTTTSMYLVRQVIDHAFALCRSVDIVLKHRTRF